MKKYLQLWYLNGLKPHGMLTINREVTNFMTKDTQALKVLTKWNH